MSNAEHPIYITTTCGMRGHFAVMMHWHSDGFYEPLQSGIGSYKSKPEAEIEARQWAEAEEVKFIS